MITIQLSIVMWPRSFSPSAVWCAVHAAMNCVALVVIAIASGFWLGAGVLRAQDDEITVYEYEPYRVNVWYAFDPSLSLGEEACGRFLSELDGALDRTFRSTWKTKIVPMPSSVEARALRGLRNCTLSALRQDDFVLLVSTKDESTSTLRTAEAAVESLQEVAISEQDLEAFIDLMDKYADEAIAAKLLPKAKAAQFSSDDVAAAKVPAAIVRRSSLPVDVSAVDELRVISLPMPWQIETVSSQYDKIFLLVVSKQADDFSIQAREIDCPMQFDGPVMVGQSASWRLASRVATDLVVRAFAPVARVESATATQSTLLLKAGGLIVEPGNPAEVKVGDVMHPIVRRDDRNGVPTLLEVQKWTYAAVTSTNGAELQVNVYSSGGTGLRGRQNRRTQRVVLRVRPTFDRTEVEVVVRRSGKPQPGCFVYERDLITDKFEYLGRTDWRGRLTIEVPPEYGNVLPEEIRRERNIWLRKQELAEADAAAMPQPSEGESSTNAEVVTSGDVAGLENEASALPGFMDAKWEVPLNAPLKQIYVKSGELVLGKLAVVPGMAEVETAELLDDTQRLEIEAFVRGYQGEIIELIGLRNLLAAKIKLLVKQGKIKEAREQLERLEALSTYNEMANGLVIIQRQYIDEGDEELPASAKMKVERMFANTRELLQKYLQNSLISDSRQLIESADSDGQ